MATRPKKTQRQQVNDILARIRTKEVRIRARRVARLKRAIPICGLFDSEIYDIEQIVFLAYGRTKL